MQEKRQTLKELFSDDPEVLRLLELREQTAILRELASKKVSLEGIEQLKGEKGEDGHIPVKGIDYLLPEEIEAIKKEITPIKGVHYFDGEDGEDGKDGKDGKSIQGKAGERGADGTSITTDDARVLLQEILEDIELGIPKNEVESLIKKHTTAVHDKLAQSIATLRGDVMRNYGGHGGSGGSGTSIALEIPVGTVDGVNTIFTVSHDPLYIEVEGQNMVSQSQDSTQFGYTYASPTITFVNAPTQTPHSWYQS